MNAPAIRAIKLPDNAWRRSWLASVAREMTPPVDFRALLRDVAPARWRSMPAGNRSMVGCYQELLRHLEQRFPIDMGVYDQLSFGMEGSEMWWWDGVPIGPMGLDEDSILDSTPAIAVCHVYSIAAIKKYDSRHVWDALGALNSMAPFSAQFGAWFARDNREIVPKTLRTPGRGRRWIGPWDGLPDLYAWVTHETGWGWLDTTYLDICESGAYPVWDADEIRDIDASWRVCRPIHQRIMRLVTHVDRDPARNVPLLAGALRGDRDVLIQLSRSTQ